MARKISKKKTTKTKPKTKAKKLTRKPGFRPKKKTSKKRASKAAKTSVLLDESLIALLNAPDAKTRKAAALLRANREKWIDSMIERAPVEGKPRGKVKRNPTAEKLRKPEPKQFYTEARAFSDGKALLQFLTHRPFILRTLGYEGFTFGKAKKRKTPSKADLQTIKNLPFVSEMEPKERAQAERHLVAAFKAANSGGIFFQVEVDYDRPQRRVELDDDFEDDSEDIWERAKKRDAKGGATKARKTRRKAKK